MWARVSDASVKIYYAGPLLPAGGKALGPPMGELLRNSLTESRQPQHRAKKGKRACAK